MSRIGAQSIALPKTVTVEVKSGVVTVKGPKGSLSYTLRPEVTVVVEGEHALVKRIKETPDAKAYHGLTRSLVKNMIDGVQNCHAKQLEIVGVGFKALIKGKILVLSLGFSHNIDFPIPEGIEVLQDEKNKALVTIRGVDKQLVGQTAANIRSMRPPEPYKGKGIRYSNENIRRKPGKAAAAKAAA